MLCLGSISHSYKSGTHEPCPFMFLSLESLAICCSRQRGIRYSSRIYPSDGGPHLRYTHHCGSGTHALILCYIKSYNHNFVRLKSLS